MKTLLITLILFAASLVASTVHARYGITMFDKQRQPIMDKYGLKG